MLWVLEIVVKIFFFFLLILDFQGKIARISITVNERRLGTDYFSVKIRITKPPDVDETIYVSGNPCTRIEHDAWDFSLSNVLTVVTNEARLHLLEWRFWRLLASPETRGFSLPYVTVATDTRPCIFKPSGHSRPIATIYFGLRCSADTGLASRSSSSRGDLISFFL